MRAMNVESSRALLLLTTIMSMPSSTANWHWKNKNVTRWAKEWFETELVGISVSGNAEPEVVKISSVKEVDGDVELGQRKSKLITIFDCKIVLAWSGTSSDGSEVTGTVIIPEVSHEITVDKLSDYQYEWTCATATSETVQAIYQLAKSKLPGLLESKFSEFPSALISTHGKDITVDGSGSGTSTPKTAPTNGSAFASGVSAKSTSTLTKRDTALNTDRVVVEATFAASAADVFSLLTDEKRIPAWSRAAAQSSPQAGGTFSFFGGGVTGKYISLTPGKEIVQEWSLKNPSWPEGHAGLLTTTLDQSTDSTKVVFTLNGVPKGMEAQIKGNLEGYYIQGLKSIGYVQLFPSSPSSTHSTSTSAKMSAQKAYATKAQIERETRYAFAIVAGMVLVAAFAIPYFTS